MKDVIIVFYGLLIILFTSINACTVFEYKRATYVNLISSIIFLPGTLIFLFLYGLYKLYVLIKNRYNLDKIIWRW